MNQPEIIPHPHCRRQLHPILYRVQGVKENKRDNEDYFVLLDQYLVSAPSYWLQLRSDVPKFIPKVFETRDKKMFLTEREKMDVLFDPI